MYGPDGKPLKPRSVLKHGAGVGLQIAVLFDGGAFLEDEKQVVELGAGRWILTDMETHADLLQRAMQAETMASLMAVAEKPPSRRARRIQQRKDRRN